MNVDVYLHREEGGVVVEGRRAHNQIYSTKEY